MEIITKQPRPASLLLAIFAILLGGGLLGYSLYLLPSAPAFGFPWAFTGIVASLLPLGIGATWIGNIIRRSNNRNVYSHSYHGTIVFSIFVIVAGVVLLCFNFGALPAIWKRVLFSWQMLLIVLAMIEFSHRHITGGGILFLAGTFFIIRRLAPIYPDIAAGGNIGSVYWPVLLIALGLLIIGGVIFRPERKGVGNNSGRYRNMADGGNNTASQASGAVDISVIFGSNEQLYLDPVFRGGHISSIFGGVVLDLRRTELPEGNTYLKIESVFGGVEIYAPEGWTIELRNESVFGGFTDKRIPAVKKTYDDGRMLVIRASNVFGGGEIK